MDDAERDSQATAAAQRRLSLDERDSRQRVAWRYWLDAEDEMSETLWAILIPGPDDVWAMPSKAAAEAAAARHNAAVTQAGLAERFDMPAASVLAQVIEWPHSADGHAEALRPD